MKLSHVLAIWLSIVLLLPFGSCAKKKEDTTQKQSDTNSESSSQSSTGANQSVETEVASTQTSTTDIPNETENAGDRLQKQQDEVRQAFISLQKVCKMNDIEGYLDLWDFETKMADGRDISLDERR